MAYETIDALVQLGIQQLSETVDVNKDVHTGVPCLKGTRFPLYRIFAELAGGCNPEQLADEFDLDQKQIETMLNAMALICEHRATDVEDWLKISFKK